MKKTGEVITPRAGRGYRSFKQRLKSFNKFSLNKKFIQLVSCGFRYIINQRYAVCHLCYLRYYNFLSNKNPYIYHAKNSPNCMILRKQLGDEWIHNVVSNYFSDYDFEHFLCKVCRKRKIFCHFKPCYHAVCCDMCLQTLSTCPYCEMKIRTHEKLYYN